MLQLIVVLGRELARRGWVLRSGGSPGADTAFEQGCDLGGGTKEIFLPWRGYNGSSSQLFETPEEGLRIALEFHPDLVGRNWQVKKLRARNVCQILGESLNHPSDLVIAWTENAIPSGGSATVLHIAADRGIPVVNLAAPVYAGTSGTVAIKRVVARAEQIAAAGKF